MEASALTNYLTPIMEIVIRLIEAVAALIIVVGVGEAIWYIVKNIRYVEAEKSNRDIRLRLGRWLMLGLEFLLAADVIATAISPTWSEIGRLAAIATIRTVLNHFLEKEIGQEREKENKKNAVY